MRAIILLLVVMIYSIGYSQEYTKKQSTSMMGGLPASGIMTINFFLVSMVSLNCSIIKMQVLKQAGILYQLLHGCLLS